MNKDKNVAIHIENALLFVLMTVEKYMLIGGGCEGYYVFIDMNKQTPMKIGVSLIKTI